MQENEVIARLTSERDFLLARAGHAGKCMFGGKRWTGVSSNALVDIAFGVAPERDSRPYDGADLAACYRTMMRLPAHLISETVLAKLEAGEAFVTDRQPGDVEWAREQAEWPGVSAIRAATLSKEGE